MFKYTLEEENMIRQNWLDNKVADKFRKLNKDSKNKFYMMDGPPYATGSIHLGTALNKILKDVTVRIKTMQGYDIFARAGYDTHGLPIENKVEKELNINDKSEIESKIGIDVFVDKCIDFATRYINSMNTSFDNLGVWMDFTNPYLTLNPEYVEGLWTTFKQAHDKGLLYKGKYPVHVSTDFGTAVAYNEIEYADVDDTSIYVKFPIKDKENEYLIIWTTTPWTLPANMGVMVNPDYNYAKIETNGQIWIVVEQLTEKLFKKIKQNYKIVEIINGKKLEDLKYDNPLANMLNLPKQDNAYRVILSKRYVNAEDGTGLVHCAPGHGKEDYDEGTKNGLPIISPVDINGRFTAEAGKYAGLKARDENPNIIEDLRSLNALVHTEKIRHEYPVCWRSHKPLLMIALPQWFFKVSAIKDSLIEKNKDVNWIPKWGQDRFNNWLENLSDWPVSRNRYWGTPLPIWVCDKCENYDVLGTYDELEKKLDKKIDRSMLGVHRPKIDSYHYKCKCGGTKSRVKDVLDVWFDSGATSWGALSYPHSTKLFDEFWPAQFNVEGKDQFRGWWNSQSILSEITFDKLPFQNVMVHGMILDINKREMHKSLGNVIGPEEVIEKYNRDYLRYFMVRESKGEDMAFGYALFKDTDRFINIVTNVANYLQTYLNVNLETNKLDKNGLASEDLWILSKLNNIKKEVLENYDKYLYYKVIIALEQFLSEDFSRTYLKLIKDRTDKKELSAVCGYVFGNALKLLAPIMPHYTDFIYTKFNKDSIHLSKICAVDESYIDNDLEQEMVAVKDIVQAGLKLREFAKYRLRWTLPEMIVLTKPIAKLNSVLANMLNVNKVVYELPNNFNALEYFVNESENLKIYVQKEFDKNTRNVWLLQELRRTIQDKRKELGFNPKDIKQLTIFVSENILDWVKTASGDLANETNTQINVELLDLTKHNEKDVIKLFDYDCIINF